MREARGLGGRVRAVRRLGGSRDAQRPKPHRRVEPDDRGHVPSDRRRHLERRCPGMSERAVGELVPLEPRLEHALDPARGRGEADDQAVRLDVGDRQSCRPELRFDGGDARRSRAESRGERVGGQVVMEERRVAVGHLRDEAGQGSLVARLEHHGAGDARRRRDRPELLRAAGNQRLRRDDRRSREARSAGPCSRDRAAQDCHERGRYQRSQTHDPLHGHPPI